MSWKRIFILMAALALMSGEQVLAKQIELEAEDLTIALHNDEANPCDGCPTDGDGEFGYWHFVITPNNNHSFFVTFHLNLDGTTYDTNVFISEGSQLDNVYVAVPSWSTLGSLMANGSTADIHWDGDGNAPDKFVLSGVCRPVPEPTTMLLLGVGLVGLAGLGRRFKK